MLAEIVLGVPTQEAFRLVVGETPVWLVGEDAEHLASRGHRRQVDFDGLLHRLSRVPPADEVWMVELAVIIRSKDVEQKQ